MGGISINVNDDRTLSIDMGNRAYYKVLQDYSINTVYNAYKSICLQVQSRLWNRNDNMQGLKQA